MANSIWNYLFKNPMGSTQLGTGNVLPGVLNTWSNLLALKGNKGQYDLYREQALEYVQTAKENAKLIKQQGEIALRNLEYKSKLERGMEVADIGGKLGNMSGSNLDVVVQQDKVRKMNAMTLKGNYTNQAMIAMVNGYRKAGQAYGEASMKARADKWGIVASVLKGVQTYVETSVNDAKRSAELQQLDDLVKYKHNAGIEQINKRYGVSSVAEKVENPASLDLGPVGIEADSLISGSNPESLSLNNTVTNIPIQ